MIASKPSAKLALLTAALTFPLLVAESLALAKETADFMTVVTVDQNGSAIGNVEFRPIRETPSQKCIEAVSNRILSSQFIPAESENMPVAAQHVELWGDVWR